jgi:hypothetical protein
MAGGEGLSLNEAAGIDAVSQVKGIGGEVRRKPSIADPPAEIEEGAAQSGFDRHLAETSF